MTQIKVLGPGCAKCKITYNNVMEALKQTHQDAQVEKIEDIETLLKYNIMTTPALVINGEIKVKGRVPQTSEIVEILKN
ncbi:thioredoxin family protein [Mangrovimonas sp. TPBH4]|uniref:thioredoxin family protein n=1 Tax=Mangrovimonas sp. TPBH4 TaxID=1645914 RepID=UPI0006B648C8|nr:thioredoxin family protein [Mangrovimonas sp. TPBH4]